MSSQLIITFLYGEFYAHVVTERAIISEWTPGAKDRSHGWHEGAFRFYLERAMEETRYSGQDVSLVVEDPDLEHLQVDLPPVKNKSRLIQLLEQEVNRQAGEEPMAWSYTALAAGEKGEHESGDHYFLHMWPRHKLNRYLDDFQHMRLSPRLIVPFSSLLLNRLAKLNQRNRPAALLQRFGYGATLLLQDSSQPKVLLRHLTGGLGRGSTRIVQEIRRSILYANQNMALQPVVLWLDDKDLFLEAQGGLDIAVKEAEPLDIPSEFALPAARLAVSSSFNLVPISIRDQRRARVIRGLVNYSTGVVFTAAITMVGLSQWSMFETRSDIEQIERHIRLQEDDIARLEKEVLRLQDRQNMIRFATGEKQPIIVWFLGDLARSAPEQLVITEISLKKDDDAYGNLLMVAELNASDISGLDKSLLEFGRSLQQEPWFLRLPDNWADTWRENYMSGAMADGSHKVPLEIEGTLPW